VEHVIALVAPEAFGIAEQLGDNARAFRACRIAIEALDLQGAATAATRPNYLEWAEQARRYAAPVTIQQVHADLAIAHAALVRGRMGEAWSMQVKALDPARQCNDAETLLRRLFRAEHQRPTSFRRANSNRP